jgi:exodeoxyribonuclease X
MGHLIRIYDFETTDMDPPAEVIEVGFCDLVQDENGWNLGKAGAWLCGSAAPMAPSARAAHHIAPAEISGLAPFDAPGLWTQAKADGVEIVCAHNLEFEAQYWGPAALPLLCTYKAALRTWPSAPSHTNGALRYWLEDQGKIAPVHEKTLPPHRAGPDAYVTAWLLLALLRVNSAADMVRWTREPRVLPTCPIGKFRGHQWSDVERGFLEWMLKQETMEADMKWNAQRELDRRSVAA